MGGYGSGRSGGQPTVESALRLDIDTMMRWGCIRPGAHLEGELTLKFYDEELVIKFRISRGQPLGELATLAIHDPRLLDRRPPQD